MSYAGDERRDLKLPGAYKRLWELVADRDLERSNRLDRLVGRCERGRQRGVEGGSVTGVARRDQVADGRREALGLPQAQRKTWGKLVANGRAEAIALGLDRRPHGIVGTVPVQHSYGFESTFLLALQGGCTFWAGKPFFPQDITCALDAVPRPRLLVTTPFHLSALLSADIDLPPLDLLLSATAPLSTALAANAEARTGAPMLEIYGSTESGQLATRRTTEGAAWTLLPGVNCGARR